MKQHEIENRYIINLVQVLYGAVHVWLCAVHVKVLSEFSIHLEFVVDSDNASVRKEIDDLIFELDALQADSAEIDYSVKVAEGSWSIPQGYRGVFSRCQELAV